ncbi:phosphopantetheine-binding protein [Kitasatospora sp. NPDC094011]|uniref:phosphopantetheine-binding protein n=1 Tax=Kitasatospora sp. NPDC094011 TaxID=3364090 RepID=UPI00380F598E
MDHAAEPNPAVGEPATGPAAGWRSPGSRTTEVVAGIWREVLELPEVETEDNFFDIGGHSIMLHMVRDRVAERLGKDVALVDLFNHPTVNSLARFIDSGSGAAPADSRRSAGGRVRGSTRLGNRRAQLGTRDRSAGDGSVGLPGEGDFGG